MGRSLDSFGAPVVSLVRTRRSLRSTTVPRPDGAGEKEGVLRGRRRTMVDGGDPGACAMGLAGAVGTGAAAGGAAHPDRHGWPGGAVCRHRRRDDRGRRLRRAAGGGGHTGPCRGSGPFHQAPAAAGVEPEGLIWRQWFCLCRQMMSSGAHPGSGSRAPADLCRDSSAVLHPDPGAARRASITRTAAARCATDASTASDPGRCRAARAVPTTTAPDGIPARGAAS